MKITRDGSSLELQITEDTKVALYCRNESLAQVLESNLRKTVLGMDAQVSLSSGILLNFDDRQGLVLETKE